MKVEICWNKACVLLLGFGPLACSSETEEPPLTEKRELVSRCFFGTTPAGLTVPLSRIVHELRATDLGTEVLVSITFNREFVDNTYGANAIGWTGKKGHAFKDLVGSDHVELSLTDKADAEVFRAKLDYLSTDMTHNSGYTQLGVMGGDGKLLKGLADDVVSSGSSLDDNFNKLGYVLVTDSPATDEQYRPNPTYPDWNFWVEYRVSVKGSAFGTVGFGEATMQFVHASPSKFEKANTVEVTPGPCPDTPTNPFPSCVRADPTTECADCTNGACDGLPDPGADENPKPLDDPDPSGTLECTRSSDCDEGEFCSEDGHCMAF